MTPDAWQAISAIVGVLGTAASTIAVAMITRTRRDARRGAEAAETAASNTEAVSNGFTRTMVEALADISTQQKRQEATISALIDTLGQHLVAHGANDRIDGRQDTDWPGGRWGVSSG